MSDIDVTLLPAQQIDITLSPNVLDVTLEIGQGPAGVPGSGAAYVHTQSSPSTLWIVNHNLGYIPHVTVSLTSGAVPIVEIRFIDGASAVSVNQLRVYFDAAQTGMVRCS